MHVHWARVMNIIVQGAGYAYGIGDQCDKCIQSTSPTTLQGTVASKGEADFVVL